MPALFSAAAADFVSPADQARLIAAAQDVPVTVLDTEEGERVVYGTTPAADAALETLARAFLPALRKAASRSRVLAADEDAFGLVLEEFVAAVRRYDLTSEVPFSATISTVLARAVSDADRTTGIIAVKENVAARYYRLLHKHDGDVGAAYDECATTPNGFDPLTFLAVHRALFSLDSLDAPAGAAAYEVSSSWGADFVDHVADSDLVAWLFTRVTDRQESILRAAYGFCDLATEKVLVDHGLRPGEVLSDVEVSEVLGISRPTVQRERRKALDVMREAYLSLLDEEAAE